MPHIISVENVSKAYRLGTIGAGDLKEDLVRWWAKARGKPDPFLNVGERTRPRRVGEQFWALKDVSFKVKEGEILGIIGRNGAGKSTLLKILSQVTAPTAGEIKIKGRIASLLEVGTGFHPDLTGRDNVFLNGTILGMTTPEIRRKFDEIVAFSEIEEFIDTPVKRYSSGMYVRLAFAVAAHLEPEILIVDEVLAVGDAPFQEKCIGKMSQAARAGRTVLFVSHNLAVVSSLCDRVLLLEGGVRRNEGNTEEVISSYIDSVSSTPSEVRWDHSNSEVNSGRLRLAATRVLCEDRITADVDIDKPTIVQYDFEVLESGLNVSSSIHLLDKHGTCVLASGTPSRVLDRGGHQHACVLPANFLNDGHYSITILLIVDVTRFDVTVPNAISFVVHETKRRGEYLGAVIGCVRPHLEWSEKSLNGSMSN
ncbi:MAG: polysaccharide ABC transporter ATP-binding protein [Verrucomicrobiota bacterium]|nr:polysaccharide ABC transporter ATP-binding protein [Verrucomicrobiota bacterium]